MVSAFNQTDDRFRAVLVCHDEPDMQRSFGDRLKVVTVNTPLPELTGYNDKPGQIDKYSKVCRALREVEADCTYCMLRDADDFVSKHLVAHAHQAQALHGYYVNSGYYHQRGGRTVVHRDRFDQLCGTCTILSSQHLDLSDERADRDVKSCPFVRFGHDKIVESMAAEDKQLQALPFAAALYYQGHGANFSHPQAQWSRLFRRSYWLPRLRELRNTRPLTRAIRDEFSLPKV